MRPRFLWITDLARPIPVVDGLLSGVVVHRVSGQYLLRPAARDPMERLLVDAGHILRGGQDSSRQEQDCKKRDGEALGHGGGFLLFPWWDYGTAVLFTVPFQLLAIGRRNEGLGRTFHTSHLFTFMGAQ